MIFYVYFQTQITLLPNQVEMVIMEQNKLILNKFLQLQQLQQKQSNNSFSLPTSMEDDVNSNNLAPTINNVLQIPTISTTNTNKSS